MNRKTSVPATTGLLAGAALLLLLTACETDGSARVAVYGDHPNRYGETTVIFEDDYDYYPAYEVYYSRNRREYVYRDGGQWVRRSQPRDVSINVLLAMPSVRVDFRDSPERHHDTVVHSYPKSWHREDSKQVSHQDNRQEDRHENKVEDRKDNRNEKAENKKDGKKNKKDRKDDDDKDERKDDRR